VFLKHRSNKQPMAVGGPSPTPMWFHLLVQLQHPCRDTSRLKYKVCFLLICRLDILSSGMRKATRAQAPLFCGLHRGQLPKLSSGIENVATIISAPFQRDVKLFAT
jgi:hypothetical protein